MPRSEQCRSSLRAKVSEDEPYDGECADQSQRVKGETITFRSRWPDVKRREKIDVDGDGKWMGPSKM